MMQPDFMKIDVQINSYMKALEQIPPRTLSRTETSMLRYLNFIKDNPDTTTKILAAEFKLRYKRIQEILKYLRENNYADAYQKRSAGNTLCYSITSAGITYLQKHFK